MITHDNTISARRRALNIVWTAACEYGFEPAFLAFTPDGEPDFYMNSIIGYVRKWYDSQIMHRLFDTVGEALLKETFDGLLWIALENCAYEKELEERPVLAELRTACAQQFFLQQAEKSRQQWMAQNSLVYTLQEARWRTVLGQEPRLLSSWEKRLFEELSYDASMTAQDIETRTLDIFKRYFRFHAGRSVKPRFFLIQSILKKWFSRALPTKMVRAEDLTFGRGADLPGSGRIPSRKGQEPGLISAAEERSNRIYIENCFGLPLYNETDSAQLEHLLCCANHLGCHLYFTAGDRSAATQEDPLIQKTLRESALQARKNRQHYQEKRAIYQNSISRLAAQIQNAILVYPQPVKILSRTGQLSAPDVWRAVYLGDERIFMDTFQEEQPDFSVDLLLDASASRLQSQEMIAAQSYVIAKSLWLCRIPTQISSFLSLRGYTVIRRFCSYEEKEQDDRIFDYSSAGWNRDGLALRGAAHLMGPSPARNRLLIVLTDASPNDDRRIPPDRENGHFTSRDYSGDAGVEDTAEEVRKLRKSGIHVMAILNGEDGSPEAARKIYGEDFVRIKNIGHLSNAVGTLLQKQIEKMRS